MVDSVLINSGRSCISCSGIWVSRHGKEIAEAVAKRIGPVAPLPMKDPKASAGGLYCSPGQAEAIFK